MWKLSELNPDEGYFLRLWEDADGKRSFVLVSVAQPDPPTGTALETEQIPFDLLRRYDLKRIASSVKLKDGSRFVFDAHGIWLTEEEAKAFGEAGGDPNKVKWINGRVPRFPPK
jgi:hypothetical protein